MCRQTTKYLPRYQARQAAFKVQIEPVFAFLVDLEKRPTTGQWVEGCANVPVDVPPGLTYTKLVGYTKVQYVLLGITYLGRYVLRWEAASEQYMVQRDATGLDRKNYNRSKGHRSR